MKAILRTISTAVISSFILSTSLSAQEEDPAAPAKEELQKAAQEFQQLLQQGVAFKDEDALRIIKQAQENNGQLNMTPEEMLAQIKKWKTNSVPARFKKLLQEKIAAKDPEAVALADKMKAAQEANEPYQMTPQEMLTLLEKWEPAKEEKEEAEPVK